MSLVNFEDEDGYQLVIVADKISAIAKARSSTTYQSIIHLQGIYVFSC